MNKAYRTLIVDDERLARVNLINKLTEFDSIDIIGEADSVNNAVKEINSKKPDLIFLDIQLNEKTGFEILNKIDFQGRIIFVTAYDQYAIQAFEVNAIDYLLKPVTKERLKEAIERLSEITVTENQASSNKKLDYDDKLFITVGNNLRFLKISSIIHITASGDYSEIYDNDSIKGLVTKTMNEWEERLPEKYFCRIHRSTIVNIEFIEKIEKWFNNTKRVYLKGIEEPLIMSRNYAKKIKQLFG